MKKLKKENDKLKVENNCLIVEVKMSGIIEEVRTSEEGLRQARANCRGLSDSHILINNHLLLFFFGQIIICYLITIKISFILYNLYPSLRAVFGILQGLVWINSLFKHV